MNAVGYDYHLMCSRLHKVASNHNKKSPTDIKLVLVGLSLCQWDILLQMLIACLPPSNVYCIQIKKAAARMDDRYWYKGKSL